MKNNYKKDINNKIKDVQNIILMNYLYTKRV